MLWLLVLALLLEGRLAEALPLWLLTLLEGRLLTVGRLLVVGLLALPLALGRAEALLFIVGRVEALPFTLLPDTEAPALPDMLPLVAA